MDDVTRMVTRVYTQRAQAAVDCWFAILRYPNEFPPVSCHWYMATNLCFVIIFSIQTYLDKYDKQSEQQPLIVV